MKSISRRRLVCVVVGISLIFTWWEYSTSIVDVIKSNKLFSLENQARHEMKLANFTISIENQTRHEMKLANFTTNLNSSGRGQDNLYYGNESIRGISKEVQHFPELAAIFQTPWKPNTSNAHRLRNNIAETISAEMILAQSNVQPFENISYGLTNQRITISTDFYNMLPKVSPIQRMYKRCSIVGNGGILRGSKCGSEIDRSDFVIRCNAPPIDRFPDDAGVKSNITTVNPSIVLSRFGGLHKIQQQSLFIKSMQKYVNYVWFPSLQNPYSYKPSFKANYQIYHQSPNRSSIKALNGNPNHFKMISRYWKNIANFRKVLSSGFYMITSAVLICEEVNLYGFWPFYTDLHNRSLSYHYFENATLNKFAHEFAKEFLEITRLHSDGILQLHVDKCYP